MHLSKMKLHTYVCVSNAARWDDATGSYLAGLHVIDGKGYRYKKTTIDHISKAQHIPCEVMVILSHGGGETTENPYPKLAFYDAPSTRWEGSDSTDDTDGSDADSEDDSYDTDVDDVRYNPFTLWTRVSTGQETRGLHAPVLLHNVVDQTELVFLM
jgi:hypothetical protein